MRLLFPISIGLDLNLCLAACSNQTLNRIEDDSMRKAGARP